MNTRIACPFCSHEWITQRNDCWQCRTPWKAAIHIYELRGQKITINVPAELQADEIDAHDKTI